MITCCIYRLQAEREFLQSCEVFIIVIIINEPSYNLPAMLRVQGSYRHFSKIIRYKSNCFFLFKMLLYYYIISRECRKGWNHVLPITYSSFLFTDAAKVIVLSRY